MSWSYSEKIFEPPTGDDTDNLSDTTIWKVIGSIPVGGFIY